jgi:hypothetical protein
MFLSTSNAAVTEVKRLVVGARVLEELFTVGELTVLAR